MSALTAIFLTVMACILLKKGFNMQLKKAEELIDDMKARRAD